MPNYRYMSSLSRQTNQIIKNSTALYQSTSQLNCRSVFCSTGIDTQVRILNNNVQILAFFNLNLINKILHYQISHIEQLINSNFQLTPNQQYIYDCYKRASKIKTNTNTRIIMPYFQTKIIKVFLLCLIFIIPSKTHENKANLYS